MLPNDLNPMINPTIPNSLPDHARLLQRLMVPHDLPIAPSIETIISDGDIAMQMQQAPAKKS
jgi:hypothetical protein